MKLIFIDTSIFIEAVTSNESGKILDLIIKLSNKKNAKILLPEVIKMEIIAQYSYWKEGVINNIRENLNTKNILGIKEELTNKGKNVRGKQKGETEAEKIDSIIKSDMESMMKKIESHYKSISDKIEQIFTHENTSMIELTDKIILSGMKRSLLKKPPYTRTEKNTENPHTKDVDCIAFESLIAFLKEHYKKYKASTLIMCVSDQDYISNEGILHEDLKKDIKINHKCHTTVQEMLNKEFNIKTKIKKKTKDVLGSLASSQEALVEESKLIAS